MKNKNELDNYYKQISKSLICIGKQKSIFLNDFKNNVAEYVQTHNSATITQLYEEFGTPQEIADSFNNQNDSLKNKYRIRKWICIILSIALLVYIIFIVASFIDVHEEVHGWFEEGLLAIFSIVGGVT